jgi:hypothetical protein
MSLVALDGTPLVAIGNPQREGAPYIANMATAATLNLANVALIFYGHVFTEDGGSHTIDTTGSSSLGWRAGAVTFANAGSTVKVGLAAMDTANGPPGRAANAAGVITLDVSKPLTGGAGGITANSWNEHVPSAGTKTIANGDLVAFCVQITARAGADSVVVQAEALPTGVAGVLPGVTSFDGTSTYTAAAQVPVAVITFSDGKYGFFYGGYVANGAITTQTWNSGSATVEYGNYFLMPVPAKIYGLIANCSIGGDCDFVLYSDPLGTPAAAKTVSIDANAIGVAATNRWLPILFPVPYSSTANQPLAAIMKPGATNVSSVYKTFNVAGHQKSETLGANGYAVNRASGAFAAQNSNKDRFAIGLLVGAFDNGAGIGVSTISANIVDFRQMIGY